MKFYSISGSFRLYWSFLVEWPYPPSPPYLENAIKLLFFNEPFPYSRHVTDFLIKLCWLKTIYIYVLVSSFSRFVNTGCCMSNEGIFLNAVLLQCCSVALQHLPDSPLIFHSHRGNSPVCCDTRLVEARFSRFLRQLPRLARQLTARGGAEEWDVCIKNHLVSTYLIWFDHK